MKKLHFLQLALVVTGVTAALLLGGRWSRTRTSVAAVPARRVLFYQDSMHPWVKSGQPDKCSVCGMDLTAIYEGQTGQGLNDNLVALSSNNITVLDVQTEEVKRKPLVRTFQVAGTLEVNETKKRTIAAPAPGRIDELTVDYAGVEVREGQPLVTFYSPALSQAKLRFLVRTRHSGEQRDPAGNLAKELDADPYYADLLAPQAGTVLERNVTKGQYVAEGEKLFTIADASVLWFRFDIYEQQLAWVHRGQKIQVTVSALPGKTYTGVISFVEPMLNAATRTVKVRADIPNPVVETAGEKERLLRFGMYAEGVLQAETSEVVLVPRTAILLPGRSAYAYVDKGNGTYERRQVRLGREGNGSWEVLGGLAEGDRVVVSGNVLLDAQAQFNNGSADPMGDGMQTEIVAMQEARESASALASNSHTIFVPDQAAAPTKAAAITRPPAEELVDHTAAKGTRTRPNRRVVSPTVPTPMPMSGSAAMTLAVPVRTNAGPIPPQSRLASLAHGKVRAPATQSPAVSLPNVHMIDEQIMDRWRDRYMAESTENASSRTNAPASFSQAQRQSLQGFLASADAIAQALATDDLAQFNQQASLLPKALAGLVAAFPMNDFWKGMIVHFTELGKLASAKDLTEARTRFLPFSANVVALARKLRKQEDVFADLKLYHCPMAPEPGLWMQAHGPLRNPFFGAKMLNCGEDVSLSAVRGDTSLARNNHDQPAN